MLSKTAFQHPLGNRDGCRDAPDVILTRVPRVIVPEHSTGARRKAWVPQVNPSVRTGYASKVVLNLLDRPNGTISTDAIDTQTGADCGNRVFSSS
ncbi:hypothetical protein MSKU9_0634 [Komagataeibacter diospyri]|uniref:Uncharacterized protein n=1 Tax=Komagataeibacter diospyri TaxID=1932662 RepID=A0A4P5NM96_9PROT|nr:hypothetical protein MSKU9_0634 [Komagataeibacter diospyri]